MEQPDDDLTALLSKVGEAHEASAEASGRLLSLLGDDPANLQNPETIAAFRAMTQAMRAQMVSLQTFADAAGRFKAWADTVPLYPVHELTSRPWPGKLPASRNRQQ